MVKIAVIGGSGVYNPDMLENVREEVVETPYGEVTVKIGTYAGREVAFLARHGSHHSIAPHKINYRANIYALKKLGVKKIIATTAVGSLNPAMQLSDFVLPNQFLDFTNGRVTTFYEGGDRGVVHCDMTDPYCPELRKEIAALGKKLGIHVINGGTYVCTNGPRYESPAEIKMYSMLGGDLVGMTNVPEVTLAQEAEMCYATISMVTNMAAGISPTKLTHQEVMDAMAANSSNFRKLIMALIAEINPDEDKCDCAHILESVGGFKL
ncbi:MAG: S-methyl-5'-thioadenosine phosphorylase [Anaerovibrio sp.]|nr:S-methyl-5'-thioadenosine phosphorylase [Selenomonadaceae bacterium]MDY6052745.1 S-methyl-5'-thioadenosine phosphorylase [Anaerovibrio sp.]